MKRQCYRCRLPSNYRLRSRNSSHIESRTGERNHGDRQVRAARVRYRQVQFAGGPDTHGAKLNRRAAQGNLRRGGHCSRREIHYGWRCSVAALDRKSPAQSPSRRWRHANCKIPGLTSAKRHRKCYTGQTELRIGDRGLRDRDRHGACVCYRNRLGGLFSYAYFSKVQCRRVHLEGCKTSGCGFAAHHTGASAQQPRAQNRGGQQRRLKPPSRTGRSLPGPRSPGLSSSPTLHRRTLRELHHVVRVPVLERGGYWREEQIRDSPLHCPQDRIRPALPCTRGQSVRGKAFEKVPASAEDRLILCKIITYRNYGLKS